MKSVVYLTCTKLPCVGTSQAPVVLCISDTIELVSGNHTLPGFLLVSSELSDDCSCQPYWRYTISYDEELLSDPDTPLTSADITNLFCETCFTDWIREITQIAACSVLRGCISVEDTSTINMSYDELTGILSAVPIISPDANNTLSIHANGLYASPGEFGNFVQGPAPSVASLGSELLTNGSFSTNLAGWTFVPGDWSWSAGTALHATGNVTPLSQNISVINGQHYLIQYTVSGAMAGTFEFQVDGAVVPTHNTIETTDTGSFSGSFIATSTGSVPFEIIPSTAFNSAFDSVSIKQVTPTALVAFEVADSLGNAYARFRGLASLSNLGIGGGSGPFGFTVSGSNNVAYGRAALANVINGGSNVAMGVRALELLGVGNGNTAIGYEALGKTESGSVNTAVGDQALHENVSGYYNLAFGSGALYSNIAGFSNVALGVNALFLAEGNYNIAIGSNVLGFAVNTGTHNNGLGIDAFRYNTTGKYGQAFGYETMFHNTTGDGNDAYGHQALRENTTGSHNSAFGYQALNLLVGGSDNVAVGPGAAATQTAGNGNIAIGAGAVLPSTTGSNQLSIGNTIYGNLSTKQISIGATTAHASAILDLTSTTRGVAIPRMTTLQKTAIAAPANIIVYDTTLNKLSFWNGAAWEVVTSA